jgi:hypothetical protein
VKFYIKEKSMSALDRVNTIPDAAAAVTLPEQAREDSRLVAVSKTIVAVTGAGVAGTAGVVGTGMVVGPTVALAAGGMTTAPTAAAAGAFLANLAATYPAVATVGVVAQNVAIAGAIGLTGAGAIAVFACCAIPTYNRIATYLNPPQTANKQA